jgi:hypothetical protein
MDTLVLNSNKPLACTASLVLVVCLCGCNKTKNNDRTSTMDAIVDGTFATDTAMQEERMQQGNYIQEQEQRYK